MVCAVCSSRVKLSALLFYLFLVKSVLLNTASRHIFRSGLLALSYLLQHRLLAHCWSHFTNLKASLVVFSLKHSQLPEMILLDDSKQNVQLSESKRAQNTYINTSNWVKQANSVFVLLCEIVPWKRQLCVWHRKRQQQGRLARIDRQTTPQWLPFWYRNCRDSNNNIKPAKANIAGEGK